MPTMIPARTLAAVLAMAVLLAACGGDDDDKPSRPEPPAGSTPELRCAP